MTFWLSLPAHSGSLKRIDYPKQICQTNPFLLNVFTALKGIHFYILFKVTQFFSLTRVQRRMISVVSFFVFLRLLFFALLLLYVAICDLVHDVGTIFHLSYVLTASGNLFCNCSTSRASLIFQKRFLDTVNT